jgi:LPXTG-motif cell wall-anchored protein
VIKRLLIISTALLVALGGTAAAQQYPPESGQLQTSDSEVPPGGDLQIEGCCFADGSTVTITIESEPRVLGTTTARADGSILARVTIPADMPAGTHTVKATGPAADGGGTLVLATVIRVSGAAQGTGGTGTGTTGAGAGTLPRTGDDSSLPLTQLALVLVVSGAALIIVARRRRTSDSPVDTTV